MSAAQHDQGIDIVQSIPPPPPPGHAPSIQNAITCTDNYEQ